MDMIKALDELLPGFQEFLFELQKVELSNDLQETLSTYLKRLDSYITEHTTEVGQDPDKPKLPDLPPPPLPGPNPTKVTSPTVVEKENGSNDMLSVEELAAQRNLSWQYANIPAKKNEKPKVIEADDIYETPINEADILNEKSHSLPDSDQEEYEVPLVSEKNGAIDDDGDVYEEPGNYENTNHQSRIIEDDDVYEDPEDERDGKNGGLSDASGSYESFDSDEYVNDPEKSAPSLPERSEPKQSRNSKAEQFKTRCENDPYILHSGILSFKTYSGTLSRISLGKWSIKYCIVYKGLLSLYNKPTDKTPSKTLTLFGYTITEQGPEGKYEHVFGIQHQGQATQNFATTTRENLETWIKVLQEESTNADNIPTSNKDPHSPPVEQSDISLKGKKKISNLVKRRSKQAPVQLNEDSEGNLAGLVNILSPVNGEPKWKERFCFVTSQLLHVYKDSGAEKLIFSQPLKGMEIGQGKPNIKRKNTLTLYQGDTVYVYIEAVNQVDHGTLLSKLIKETGFGESLESAYVTPPEQMDMPQPKTSTSKQPSIFSLMQRFEMPTESDGTHDSVYLEMDEPSDTKPDAPTLTVEDAGNEDIEPVYENNTIRSIWKRSKPQKQSPNIKRKDGKEKDKEKDKEKKEKKEKKKKKKKDKEKKSVDQKEDTEDNTESVDVSSQLNTQTSTDASATEDVAETKIKVKSPTQEAPKIENKFVTSDKKHLLDVDRLQSERKILLEKREDLRIKKTELRRRKNACEDETKKAKLDQEYKEVVQEWTASSKELTDLDERIQKLSKGEETDKLEDLKTNSATGRSSPMLQRVQSSKSIADRMKMFEAMSGKD